jgi:hypothetical protein
MMMRTATVVLSFAMLAAAASLAIAQTARTPQPTQTPSRDRPPAMPVGTALIQGRVVAADNGRPLSLATITANAPELGGESRTISTNSEGRYELRNLPAGRYTLLVSRSGYLTVRFGQRRVLEPGKPLQVLDGQIAGNIDFTLPRMGVISGRVTDEEGEPVAGALVSAMQSMYFNGSRGLVPMGGGVVNATDEDGQFRIVGLVPGAYAVMAQLGDTWPATEAGVERMAGYAKTYFPGTTSAEGARRLTLGIGEEVSNTDFSLIPGRSATISGTLLDSRGRPMANGFVALTQSLVGPNGGIVGGGNSTRSGADGGFTIRNVMPGPYILTAAGLTDRGASSVAETTIMPIVIDSVDVTLALTTSGGWSVTGRVVTDDGTFPGALRNDLFVVARPEIADNSPIFAGGDVRNIPGNGQVKEDGTFMVAGVLGRARIAVANLPAGWTQKAILHDGRNVAGKPLDITDGGAIGGVQVVVSNRTTTVAGQLIDDTGAPISEGTIVVFSDDRERWFEGSRFVRAVRPDQNGRYEIEGLPPDEYLAVAVDYVQEGLWNDPDYLESLKGDAQMLTLEDGESRAIALKLVRR